MKFSTLAFSLIASWFSDRVCNHPNAFLIVAPQLHDTVYTFKELTWPVTLSR